MSTFFQQAMVSAAKAALKRKKKGRPIPHDQFDKELRMMQAEISFFTKNFFFLSLGVLSATVGLKGFLLPNQFIYGGVTGISLLMEIVTEVPLSIYLIGINLPFLFLGLRTNGPGFALRSLIAILMLAVCVHYLYIPTFSDDKLLIAVFGGFFLGLGIGLVIRGGAVIDGTEVLTIFISRKSSISIGGVILVFNVIIFSFGAYVLSLETAFYAILTYFAASRTVDFVIDGVEEYIGVTIVTRYSEDVRLAIIEKMGRGCTIYLGKRGFARRGEPLVSTDIIFTVVTRLELARLQKEVNKIDGKAFVVMGAIKDTKGGMVRKRSLVE